MNTHPKTAVVNFGTLKKTPMFLFSWFKKESNLIWFMKPSLNPNRITSFKHFLGKFKLNKSLVTYFPVDSDNITE